MEQRQPITFQRPMRNYWQPATQKGRIERVLYLAPEYLAAGKMTEKIAYVYLPHDYDETKAYDIFYYMHGGDHEVQAFWDSSGGTSALQNLLDNMIESKDIRPMIVVTPTFYQKKYNAYSSMKHNKGLTDLFPNEYRNYLIPVVEKRYCTYAKSIRESDLVESRGHRGFGGFSMGAVTTWNVLMNHLDITSIFLPQSGDSWYYGIHAGGVYAEKTAGILRDSVIKAGYGMNSFSIYAATGTNDMAYPQLASQIEAMKKHSDVFRFSHIFGEGNFYFNLAEGGFHDYEYVFMYLYNALSCYFPDI